jgi:citrate lyase subunit beta/citryl-CoA lyase
MRPYKAAGDILQSEAKGGGAGVLLRSLLFVPGVRPDMLQKAGGLPADALVPDMEDSVPVAEKARARETIARVLPSLARRGQKVIPRANSLASGLLADDLAAIAGPHIFGVTVGKVESSWTVAQIDALISALERRAGLAPGAIRLIPWIESAKAVAHALEICAASPRIVAVAFGAEDFTADMGIPRTEDGAEVAYPRSAVAVAARATDVAALDTPRVNFRDPEGLRRDAALGRQLGYRGKFAIHPSQIEAINAAFTPSAEEVEYARRVVQAAEEAEARGHGATSLDGKMIDVPIVVRARKLLALAQELERAGR